jgi:hypothetical protein
VSARALGLLLTALAASACVVPGLEVGAGSGGGGGAQVGGAGSAGDGGSSAGGGAAFEPSSGAAGTAGAQPVPRCEDLPIPPKSAWMVAASSSSLGNGSEADPLYNPPRHVIDGTIDERWASGLPQEAGQWFHIDFGATAAISEVTLQQGTDLDDYPRGYEISLSYRHTDFEAVASASGQGASVSETVIPLEKVSIGRYMLIRQTGNAPRWWSIAEVDVACH